MPLYEYKCLKCGRHTDKIEKVDGPHLAKCPHCGGKVESVITAPAIQFKGSGWYVTDYAGKSGKVDGAKAGDSGESKDGGDSKESKGSSDSKDAGSKGGESKNSGGKDSGSKESKSSESKGSKEKKASKEK